MQNILYYMDQFNLKRADLKLEIHWVPDFILSFWNFSKSFIRFFLFFYFLFMPFFFVITGVVSGSMTPTCQTNEIVLSSKIGYGIKLSKILPIRTEKEGFFDKYLWQYETPKLGDIVAFQTPEMDKKSIYTKRIVGIAGDSVQFKNGILYINKIPVKLKFIKNYSYVENNKEYSGNLYEETLPNNVKYNVFYHESLGSGSLDNTVEFKVPKGFILAVGDNRHMSDDGRSFLGFVNQRDILGRVVMVLFSNGNITSLNIAKFVKGMRFDRCLKWMI